MAVLVPISRDASPAMHAGLVLDDALPAHNAAAPSPVVVDDDEAPADDEAGDCFTPPRSTRAAVPRVISNLRPARMLEGTSGVYLLTNEEGVGVAVFKPLDEENLPEEASKWAVSNGMGHFRERAAFMVSDEVLKGYSGVPDTVIATVKHEGWAGGEKRGSLQRFVPASSDMSDRGPANIPAEEVQKVGILDILLFNMDRHEGNLLLCSQQAASEVLPPAREALSLVPIDHGLCLPEIISQHAGPNHELLRSIYFVWQNWPQARQPFSNSVRRLLDRQLKDDLFRTVIAHLVDDMGRNSLTCGALTTLKIGAMVLRNAVKSGLNLSEIANLVSTALAGMLQESWEKVDKEMRKMKGRVQENTSQHSAADDKQQAAAVGDARHEQLAVVPYNGPSDEAMEMYLLWETRLLDSLEQQLGILLSAHTAAGAGNSASAAAAAAAAAAASSEQTGEFKEAEGVEGAEGDVSASLAESDLAVSDRIQILDESAISADEDEDARSARSTTLLPTPERDQEGSTLQRRRSSSVPYERSLRSQTRGNRSRGGRLGGCRSSRTQKRRSALSHAAFKLPLTETMARRRGGRRRGADEVRGLRLFLDQLEIQDADKDNPGDWAPHAASKGGKNDVVKSAPLEAAAESISAPRAPKNVCA